MATITRVALFSPTSHIGGAERNLLVMCQALKDRGIACVVILPPEGVLVDALQGMGIATIGFPETELKSGQIIRVLWNCLRLWPRLRKFQPQLLHANSIFGMYLPVILGSVTRIPSVVHWADFDTRTGDIQLVKVTAPRNRVIAVSDAIRETLITAGAKGNAITVIHNGNPTPDPTNDSRTDIATEFSIPVAPLWLGITGRIDDWKGHGHLIEAMALLKELPLHLIILGGGNGRHPAFEAGIRRQVIELGLSDRITFTGFQSDPARIVRCLDIVICPSDYEPFGLVATEAMALAKPVIASATGGFLETIISGETGILVPPKSATALAAAIRQLATNDDLRHAMGIRGYHRYLDRFSVRPFIDSITAHYNQAI
jgi:glycosyltransferase involved in cell wall biosynthesis